MHRYLQLRLTALNTSCAAHYKLDQVESIETIRWCADLPHFPRVGIWPAGANPRLPIFSATSVAYPRTLGQLQGCVLPAVVMVSWSQS